MNNLAVDNRSVVTANLTWISRWGSSRLLQHTVPIALIGGLLVYGAMRLWLYAQRWDAVTEVTAKMDYRLYMDAAQRVLAGGPVYPAWQLTGPVTPAMMPELYPPSAVYGLFVPMSLLPPVLWWAIPLAIIAGVVWHHRPSPWGWVGVLALFIAWPHTWTAIQLGNPIMWVAAFAALGTIWRPLAILVLLKPTLAPFALIGVRSGAWWIAGTILGLVSLAMIPAWLEYLQVLRNLSGFDWTYSLHDVGIVAIPVVAWLSRTTGQTGSPSSQSNG